MKRYTSQQPQNLRIIFRRTCHVVSKFTPALCLISCFFLKNAFAQQAVPSKRADAPAANEVSISAVTQEAEGSLYKLRGVAVVETSEMIIRADEIDYDRDRDYAEARGNVKFDYFASGEHLEADKVEYNLAAQTGRYYNVRGSTPAKLESRPGILSTTSPFSFEGNWAERINNRYILHDGFITNCKLPRPWWVLRGTEFDVVPGDRAVARNAVFRLRGVPLFYSPFFYKALDRAPRKSGFLIPNFGNSSRRGYMLGAGYYWAINRSYDATYRAQLFTQRGLAHNVDVRGRPNALTDFNFLLYGVKDRGQRNDDGSRSTPQSGFLTSFSGKTQLAKGFLVEADINYLSSFAFRRTFTESFYEAIFSQVQSVGYLTKHWSTFGFNVVGSRVENFPSDRDEDKISLRRLPSVEFKSRDRMLTDKILPVWFSFDSSASMLRRSEREFQTGQFVQRYDVEPRISTALRWQEFHLIPSFSLRGTQYGSSFSEQGSPSGGSLWRGTHEVSADLIFPSISKIFEKPPKAIGSKLKHVIEPRATFRNVGGVDRFDRPIRFDETELISNTTELELSITNRLYTKNAEGMVHEVLSWSLAQQRYFDTDFGGALITDRRNIVLSTARLTAFSFLDRPRNYSPVVSILRANSLSGLSVEWLADYDPLLGRFANSNVSLSKSFAHGIYATVGHNQLRSSRFLIPPGNQLDFTLRAGEENRRGWSTGVIARYDYRQGALQWMQSQVTYNTDCCGWSVQYRRFGVQPRLENQFRVAFAIANIGTFGTLKKQDRMF